LRLAASLGFDALRKPAERSVDMGPIVLGALIALIFLVLTLAGSQFARHAVILAGGLMGAALLAIWFLLRPA
jgi:hypothetical protein